MADASDIKPKLVPQEHLMPRDNSGGRNFDPHNGVFGDGGYVFGDKKPYLSASGGKGKDYD